MDSFTPTPRRPPPVSQKPSPEEAESVATASERRTTPAEVRLECGSHLRSCGKDIVERMPNGRARLPAAPKKQLHVHREGCSWKRHPTSGRKWCVWEREGKAEMLLEDNRVTLGFVLAALVQLGSQPFGITTQINITFIGHL